MRNRGVALVVGFACVVLVASSDLTGTWDVDTSFDNTALEGGEFDCVVKQDGEGLKGACSGGTAQLEGEVKGRNVTWRLGSQSQSTEKAITFTGSIDEAGTRIRGRFVAGENEGSFTASRSK